MHTRQTEYKKEANMKKCSASLLIKEMQMKTICKNPIKLAKLFQGRGCGEVGIHLFTAGSIVNWYSSLRKRFGSKYKEP